ncbi:MAG: hypothetical protein ACUVQ8_05040 [Nitrososphaeria archaeon]
MKIRFTLSRRHMLILAVAFGILSAISLAAAIYYLTVPTETEVVTDVWSYELKANYDVVA